MANDLQLRVLLNVVDKALGPLKRIAQGSTGTARSLKAARDQLKALNAAQRDVSGYRQQSEAVRQTSEKLAQAQEKLRGLRQELKATSAPTAQFQRQFLQASQKVQQLTIRHGQQRAELHKLSSSLRTAGADTRKLSEYEQQLGQRMASASRRIEAQQQRLAAYGRARNTYDKTQAFAGKAAVAGAAGIGRGLYAPIEAGKHYTLEAQRVAALGLGDKATADAIKFAKAMQTYGTSATENLTLVRDAMSIFADEHHAEMVAPTLSKMKFANEAMYGQEGGAENERQFMDMLKVIELRGGLASKEAFEKQANIVQQVLTATGGRVGPNEWLNVIKTGGLAAKGQDDSAFYYQLEPLVQEMGGNRVGTALMSAYQNLYQGRTTKRAANNLERLGLVDPTKVKHDKAGQIAFLDVGAIKDSKLFRANQFEWMEKVLLPQLAAKGITDQREVLDAIGSIFSNRTASNLFSQMYLQRGQIHKNAALNAGADNIDKLYDKGKDTAQGKELEARARLNNAYLQASTATYTVDETEHSGAPDVLSIRARSADLRKALKVKRERSWSNATLGQVLRDIAAGNQLEPAIAEPLDALPILQLDQANESDANLLTRLGEEYDAVATVKAGCLLFMPAGGGQSVSGQALPHITLTRADGDQHRYLQADRDAYDGVKAYYYDVNSAKKQEAIAGGGDNLKELRHTYADLESALRAARSEWNRLQRGSATLSYTLARARPDLIPELTYSLHGVKDEIDAIVWYSGNLLHSLTDQGFTTALELEAKLPEDLVSDLADQAAGDFTGILAWYRDDTTATEQTLTAGDQTKPRRLPFLYANKSTAKRAVDREWNRMQRHQAKT